MSKVTCFNVPENPYGQLLSMVFPLGVRIQVIFLNNSSLQKSSSELPAGTTMGENWKCSALKVSELILCVVVLVHNGYGCFICIFIKFCFGSILHLTTRS